MLILQEIENRPVDASDLPCRPRSLFSHRRLFHLLLVAVVNLDLLTSTLLSSAFRRQHVPSES